MDEAFGILKREIENLTGQKLRMAESASLQEEPFDIKVAEFDFELLRYACAFLESRLEEAARHDCAQLIAESILDVSGGKEPNERWSSWLSTAPYWPQLAHSEWRSAVSKAADIVVGRLEAAGVNVNRAATNEIDNAVSELMLRDVLSPDVYARFFPESSTKEDEMSG